jgi:hypothetical protein
MGCFAIQWLYSVSFCILSTIKVIFRKFLSNFTFRARCLTVLVPLMINIKHVWLLFVISMFMPNLSKLGTVSYLIYHLLVESLFFKLATSMAIITPLCNKIKHGMAQLCSQYAFFALLFRAECITRWFVTTTYSLYYCPFGSISILCLKCLNIQIHESKLNSG